MDTAPKDGTRIWVRARWLDGDWLHWGVFQGERTAAMDKIDAIMGKPGHWPTQAGWLTDDGSLAAYDFATAQWCREKPDG